jgi:hypothetical protein
MFLFPIHRRLPKQEVMAPPRSSFDLYVGTGLAPKQGATRIKRHTSSTGQAPILFGNVNERRAGGKMSVDSPVQCANQSTHFPTPLSIS